MTDLFARIGAARDLAEACTALIGSVVAPRGIERALLFIPEDDALRGLIGVGWEQREIRAARISLKEEAHPLVRAFLDSCELRSNGEDVLDPLSLVEYHLLPIGPGEGGPAAVLVLDLAGFPGDAESILGPIRQLQPVLKRVAELDRFRQRTRVFERQRNLHDAVLNALPDPLLITDPENTILLENRRAEYLFTAREGDSDGRRRAVEINNLLFSSFLTRSVIDGSEPGARELNLVDPTEGGDLLFEVLSTPLAPGTEGEGAMVSVLRKVTDLKSATPELEHHFSRVRQAEHKSRSERDRLNLILENVGDPILVTDDQSNIILMNREAERLFEVPAGTGLQSRVRREVRANDTKFSSFISDFALGPDGARVAEFHLTDPDTGEEFPVEVVSGKILNDRGEMTAIVSILHDLTKVVENERLATALAHLNEGLEDRIRSATVELEERNQRLEWQSRELERAYRLKSQFLASMSHELRTPINALLGYTSLMQEEIYGGLNKRQKAALERMNSASQHLLELVNDILDLAKIEAGKMPVHLETVDVAMLMREVSTTVEPMLRSKGLDYDLQISNELPVLETDATKLRQIMLNLLSNAVKFTREGTVSLSARPAPGNTGVVIAIADTGIGIAEEDLPKIFDDFRQVDQSSTREYGGTGLGLSITKKLLTLLGGTIRVDSQRGTGSTFYVWLPSQSSVTPPEDVAEQLASASGVVLSETGGAAPATAPERVDTGADLL